jgi:hypothetical protein
MTTTETSGNPEVTEGDLEDWLRESIGRIDGILASFDIKIDHQDQLLHEIHQALSPLRDHPEAVAKGLSLLDPGAGVRKYFGKGKPKAAADG